MLKNKFTPFAWSKIIGNDKVFELISFQQEEIPTWEDYVKRELDLALLLGRYERADAEFNKDKFLNDTKRSYDDYVDYLKKLWGRYKLKEKVKILPYYDHVYLMVRYNFDENLLETLYEVDLGVSIDIKEEYPKTVLSFGIDENYIERLENRPQAIYEILPMWLYIETTAILAHKVGLRGYSYDFGYNFCDENVKYGIVFDTNRISYDGINLIIDNAVFKKV